MGFPHLNVIGNAVYLVLRGAICYYWLAIHHPAVRAGAFRVLVPGFIGSLRLASCQDDRWFPSPRKAYGEHVLCLI